MIGHHGLGLGRHWSLVAGRWSLGQLGQLDMATSTPWCDVWSAMTVRQGLEPWDLGPRSSEVMPCNLLCLYWRLVRQDTAGGRQKKIDGPPPYICWISDPPTRHPTFFSWLFFLVRFLGVSRQGEFKNTIKIFWQKVRVESIPKISTKNSMSDVSFSSTFFVLSHFRVFLAMGVQKHYKKLLQNKSCRKGFTKKSTRAPKPMFSRFVLITLLCFSRWGEFKNTTKQILKKNLA
jgi:hypothetical protein